MNNTFRDTILIVDDDIAIIRILRSYLEQANYNVLTANDGTTAIQLLRNKKPDLLVLDLMLPDKDGWDITRFIRADKKLSTVPIIMLTARVDDADKIIGVVEIVEADYVDLVNSQIVTKTRNDLGITGELSATSLWVSAISRDTDTYTASGITIKIGVRQL